MDEQTRKALELARAAIFRRDIFDNECEAREAIDAALSAPAAPVAQPVSEPSDDELTQSMLKACPFYGPSPSRDAFIMGWERAVLALEADLDATNIRLREVAALCATAEAERDQLRQTISEVAVLLHEAGARTDRCTTADAVKSLAAERDQLRAALAASEASGAESIRMYREARDERDQLRAEVEALRADAERYRWLRSENQTVAGPCAYAPWMGPPMFSDELDFAIDAARKQQ